VIDRKRKATSSVVAVAWGYFFFFADFFGLLGGFLLSWHLRITSSWPRIVAI